MKPFKGLIHLACLAMAIQPATATAEQAVLEAAADSACPNRPNVGTWGVITEPMSVQGVPTWLGGGFITIDFIASPADQCDVIADIEGLGSIYFRPLGNTKNALSDFIVKYIALNDHLGKSKVGFGSDGGDDIPAIYSKLLNDEIEKFTNPKVGALEQLNIYGAPAVTYYGGIPEKEPRIFWILGVVHPGAMWSMHGFAYIKVGDGSPAPPHLQKHFWSSSYDTNPGEEKLKEVKDLMSRAKAENLKTLLGDAYQAPPGAEKPAEPEPGKD